MAVELKITYDGTEPGLREHRLSLSSFGKPLSLLLAALRRTASGIISQALDNPEYGKKGGKFADAARQLDLELVSLEPGCARPTFVCVARQSPVPISGQTAVTSAGVEPIQQDLMAAAVERLIRDIDDERSGRLRNALARQYLDAIPAGVTQQQYIAMRDGKVFVDVSFGVANLAAIPAPLPRLIHVSGSVTGVGFEPGATFVGMKTKARTLRCMATPQQVEAAVRLHAGTIVAAVLDNGGDKPTLIWIRAADCAAVPPTVEETARYAHAEWGHTLEALAK